MRENCQYTLLPNLLVLSFAVMFVAAPIQAKPVLTTISSFTGSDGSSPSAGVNFDSHGNIFGTTTNGGAFSGGTVFEIVNGSTSITSLASFQPRSSTFGYGPNAGVTLDSHDNLFGTTVYGGSHGDGTVFELAEGSSSITTLSSFGGAHSGFTPEGGVTFDNQGNLFGTTTDGGSSRSGTVYEIVHGSSSITTLASFTGRDPGTNGATPLDSVTFDSAGDLFGTTRDGGEHGIGTVFEIAKGTSSLTTLASFKYDIGPMLNAFNPISSVTFDKQGDLFGTTYGGGSGFGAVYEIAHGSDSITSLASFSGDGTPAGGAYPLGGVTLDSRGDLFGTTSTGGVHNGGTVFELAKGASTLTTLISFAGRNGSAPDAGLTFDSHGNLFGTTSTGGAKNDGTVFEITGATTPVPEASTVISFGLMLAFGFVGFAIRRRSHER